MNKLHKTVLVCLALLTSWGCADLDVTNPNEPDRERAVTSAEDIEALVAGAFLTWYQSSTKFSGNQLILSSIAFQHSGWPANEGVVEYSAIPRGAVTNSLVDEFYPNIADIWEDNYEALALVREALTAVNESEDLRSELGPEQVRRMQAYGKFMQGLSHASIALVYDQGFQVDETLGADEDPPVQDYQALMQTAMGYFDQAVALAEGGSMAPIPAEWMSKEVTAGELVSLIHAMKARYMASVARTPEERQNVDWVAVENEIAAAGGEEYSFTITRETTAFAASDQFNQDFVLIMGIPGFQQLSYFILGMADQSGNYQRWLDQPIADRVPDPGGEPVLIQTPDARFPTGTTVAEQQVNPGAYYSVPGGTSADGACLSASDDVNGANLNQNFQQPGRGTFRWSYYFMHNAWGCNFEWFGQTQEPLIKPAEMRLLQAEADLRQGNVGGAATLVNVSRMAHGLDDASVDADGNGNPNDDCVPRLPDGTCGDLMEMLKWEKRIETQYYGLHSSSWYFDGRGWGDLYEGTFLHLPIPEQDLSLLDMSVYTTGDPGAEPSVYQWPGES